ncbi:MAG: YgeY family selenium metabolism-linked hydrolase [bacterium]|nr:YgeY family selenium metabolism-linked hydrolase [bacterium]
MREKIERVAESLRGDLVTFLREIIAIPSMNGKEKNVIERIKEEMEKIGYDKVWVDPLGNLLGQMGTGDRLIALDGHADTVGIGNPDTWEVDPFKGDYRDGIIYGRGASDQKGGLASAVYAGKILKETGIPDNVSLLVTASVLEEDYEGLCWQYILKETDIKPEAVLLTEPSNLQIMIGQRGRMELKVKTQGISCHGSAPERGENAIYKIAPIIRDIEQFNKKLHSESILGKGTVVVTDVSSSAPSLCAVPDSAVLHLDLRLTEGETLESCVAEVAGLPSVKAVDARVTVPEYNIESYTGLMYPTRAYFPMWLMERAHPVVRAAERAYGNQFLKEPEVGVWGFSTNGVATKGGFDIPTIGFGPGKEDFAHTPYDQINESDLVKAMQFYAAFILEC